MLCEECGREFEPSRRGSPSKYCSGACRAKAYRKRRKTGDAGVGKRDAGKPGKGQRPSPAQPLNSREFERMMDGKLEDVLRRNRDRLQAALDDPGTPATALPAISRQLIAVCRELESLAGDDPLLDLEDEPLEVSADAGASIV